MILKTIYHFKQPGFAAEFGEDKEGVVKLNYIHHGDCLTWLKTLPDNSVDIVWTDPPYGFDNNSEKRFNAKRAKILNVNNGERVTDAKRILNDGYEEFSKLLPAVLIEINRILKPVGCCCCCCAGGGGVHLLFSEVGEWIKQHLQFCQAVVWDKAGLGVGWYYRRSYEFVMVGYKKGGKLKWDSGEHGKRASNIVRIPRPAPTKTGHPTPKPVELVKHFLSLHGSAGNLVCDPFMGGGTTAIAATRLGMDYIGAELDPHWHEYALRRIAAEDGAIFDEKTGETIGRQESLFTGEAL